MVKLNNGTKVHVEFDGTTVTEAWVSRMLKNVSMMDEGLGGFIAVSDTSGIVHLIWNYGDGNVLAVIDPEPEFWPPRAGDIWEADGNEYFARENRADSSLVVVLEAATGSARPCVFWHASLDKFKALNPVLIRRR